MELNLSTLVATRKRHLNDVFADTRPAHLHRGSPQRVAIPEEGNDMNISPRKTFVALIVAATAATALGAGSWSAQAAAPTTKVKPGPSHAQADPAFLAKERAASRGVASSVASQAAVAKVQARVANYVARNGTKYTFGTYGDPATGDVVVDTNAPAAVVASLTNLRADKSLTGVKVRTHRTKTTDAFNRRDDVPAFWGGAGLLASGAICSSGYAVQDILGGRYMTTAGHCFADGTVVNTESNLRPVGTVLGRALASLGSGPLDMELLYGQSYAGRIYTGGTTSTTSIPVVTAGTAYVGYNDYCHSGRTTGEQCGHTATSINAQVCTASGCKSPVIAFTGGNLPQGGDSGSPFYAKNASGAYIRGHVIAVGGGTGYAETWLKVADRYGVSIVTG
jgi:hypothetical protein